MKILSSQKVIQFIKDPLKLCQETVSGVDLTIDSIKELVDGKSLNCVSKNKTKIYPDTYEIIYPLRIRKSEFFILSPGIYSITFDQGILVPRDVIVFIHQRSSLLRIGIQTGLSPYDSGFDTEKLATIIEVNKKIMIERHSSVCGVVAYPREDNGMLYNGQWQREKDFK